ncbi:Putative outer membrane protein [Croceitalea dokdonensis DOKDO 023]|uniref:Putative outer membrane protein n=2 Tax=Croceitalea TaxID=574891 RepID=A0A0P7ANP3_9FLAO|nr:Putative outer membrane protein [Croceitalea dokdonensis DOKDO 023]
MMAYFLRTVLMLLWLALPLTLSAQEDLDFIQGILLDANTKEAVVFATIRVQGLALGVISNNDGSFQLPTEFQQKGDTLIISSMGYETLKIDFASLKKNLVKELLVKPSVFELSETIVTANRKRRPNNKVGKELSALEIIDKAIANIPLNYPQKPFGLIGYYRDYQFKENTYSNLNEALVSVRDRGFAVDDYKSIQFGLFDYRTNRDFNIDSFADKPYDYSKKDKYIPDATVGEVYAPNELVLLFIHDAIRNHNINSYSYVHKFVTDFVKEHTLTRTKNTSYGDKGVYSIAIRKKVAPFQVMGTIYVDKITFAIRKLVYSVYKQPLKAGQTLANRKAKKELIYEILVEYQDYKDQMYLNYISFHNNFKLVRPPEFYIKDAELNRLSKRLLVTLNRPAANWLTLKPSDFKVFYQNTRLWVTKVERIGTVGDTYALSFIRKERPPRKLLRILESEIKDPQKASFKVSVNKMMDAQGNFLEERKSELLDQFREFFTQKVIPTQPSGINANLQVNKTISLGSKDQPKLIMNLEDDFWMNTPLKSLPQE